MTHPVSSPRMHTAWMMLGILLIAANLRVPLTIVPPLLNDLAGHLGLQMVALGALIATPVFVLALASPLATFIAHRKSLEYAFSLAALALIAGLLLRSVGTIPPLYIGSVLVAIGIAIGNVLLPSLVKRDFPQDKGSLTAAYALALGITATLGSALSVPLAHGAGLGWQITLALPLLVAVPTACYWLPRNRRQVASAKQAAQQSAPALARAITRYALSWQVTGFLGLNSFLFFLMVSWLPTILQDAGYSAQKAGSLHGLMLLSSVFPSVVLIAILRRLHDQRALAVATSTGMWLSCLGLALAPKLAALWAICFGVSAGAGFITALSLITLRTRHHQHAARLSGLAHFIGQLMAGFGLLLTGWMRNQASDWSSVLTLAVAAGLVMTLLGYLSGRNRHLA